jgi:outer membrane protein OmpA-like peptidoglycan-associated protein/outer membrane protein W
MKKTILGAATLGAMALAVTGASAQTAPATGFYVGLGAGANFHSHERGVFGTTPGRINFSTGHIIVLNAGYGFGNGIRAEIEASYRRNTVHDITAGGVRANRTQGWLAQYGVMGNAYYDIPLGLNLGGFSINPYVGAGLGYMWSDYDDVRGDFTGSTVAVIKGSGRLAFQGIVGVAVGLDSVVPGLSLTTEYRYLNTRERDARSARFTAVETRGSFRGDNHNHAVLMGLRYAFGTPAPAPVVAPAPAPAPAPARTFLVFFDWDRADLTDRARQIIAEAATNARTVSSTRIEVSGHADRTGAAAYNQRLSVRRAEAVAAELVRRGINRNEITIQGFGFDRPLVPTAQGVREPQNRRVEIVLR